MTQEVLDNGNIGEANVRSGQRFVEILDAYERPLYSFLMVLLSDHHLALDCLQETFLRAYQNLGRKRPVTGGWLYRVARNLAVDEFRRRPAHVLPLEAELEASMETTTPQSVKVRHVLASLSAEDREVLYLFLVDRFKTAEIADLLDINPGTVRMRLSRARKRFRALYGGTI